MISIDSNKIGDVGETFLTLFLLQKTAEGYLFDPLLIGGKWPTVDMYAELTHHKGMFCFFQVKTTIRGCDRFGRLRIGVEKHHLQRLSAYQAPSYLVGIDLNQHDPKHSRAFLMTVRGLYTQKLLNLPTRHELTADTLLVLRDEIHHFWKSANVSGNKTVYPSAFDL